MLRQLACSCCVLVIAHAAGAQGVVHLDARVNGPLQGVEVSLTAGHWRTTLIEPSTDPEAMFQAWAFMSSGESWRTSFRIFLEDDAQLPHGGLFAEAPSAQDAWNETVAAGRDVHLFTVPDDQIVTFEFSDSALTDNQGGVSFRLEPSEVPEPSALLSMTAAGLTLAAAARRKRRLSGGAGAGSS